MAWIRRDVEGLLLGRKWKKRRGRRRKLLFQRQWWSSLLQGNTSVRIITIIIFIFLDSINGIVVGRAVKPVASMTSLTQCFLFCLYQFSTAFRKHSLALWFLSLFVILIWLEDSSLRFCDWSDHLATLSGIVIGLATFITSNAWGSCCPIFCHMRIHGIHHNCHLGNYFFAGRIFVCFYHVAGTSEEHRCWNYL